MTRKITIPEPKKIEELLEQETDPEVRVRLMMLNIAAKFNGRYPLAEICDWLKIPRSTALVWIRRWREDGYEGIVHPWPTTGGPIGRPPTLSKSDLDVLKKRLEQQPHWQIQEIVELIEHMWGVRLSASHVAKILKKKLHLHFGKPYPHDVRRPDDAPAQLEKSLANAYNRLQEKGVDPSQVALGFLDESSPQTTANTARTWQTGSADLTKNTTRYKANAIGFYALFGHPVSNFLPDSTQESIREFFEQIREANPEYPAIIVILDNFSSHRAETVRQAARDLGIELVYLPPYSPDLNPIEFIWKTIKRAVSLKFIHSLYEMRQTIAQSWNKAAHKCSYARHWIDTFFPGEIENREFCG